MASAAEQLAANISLASFSKATELKKRLWFTLGALVLFRFLSFVPMPGIDPRAMAALFETQRGGVLDFFNTFSGGCARADERHRAGRDAIHHRLDRRAARRARSTSRGRR